MTSEIPEFEATRIAALDRSIAVLEGQVVEYEALLELIDEWRIDNLDVKRPDMGQLAEYIQSASNKYLKAHDDATAAVTFLEARTVVIQTETTQHFNRSTAWNDGYTRGLADAAKRLAHLAQSRAPRG
jgi:hypothetical protein